MVLKQVFCLFDLKNSTEEHLLVYLSKMERVVQAEVEVEAPLVLPLEVEELVAAVRLVLALEEELVAVEEFVEVKKFLGFQVLKFV